MKHFSKFAALFVVFLILVGFASCQMETEPEEYNVTISNSIENGKIIPDKIKSESGEVIKLTVTPDAGYELKSLTIKDTGGNNIPVQKSTETEYVYVMPKSDVSISAEFTKKAGTYIVTFNTNGGTVVNSQTVIQGQKVIRPADPAKTSTDPGYRWIFDDWYILTETHTYKEFDFDTVITSDITLYAMYDLRVVSHTVSFNSNGGTTVSSQSLSHGQKAIRPSNPTKASTESEAYAFENWYTSTDNGTVLSSTPFDFDTEITEDITLYAKWTTTPVTNTDTDTNTGPHTVSFLSDRRWGYVLQTQTIIHGKKATKPEENPTKSSSATEAYVFENWYTSTDNGTTLSATPFDFDTPITEDIRLYPNWITHTEKYSIIFNTNGGNSITSQSVLYGQRVTRPENPEKAASVAATYYFENWYTSTDNGTTLSSTPFDFNTAITNDTTLYAKWNEYAISYTVSFNSNGGTYVSDQSVTGGSKATVPSTEPIKSSTVSTNYTFGGWYASSDEGKTLFAEAFDFDTAITSNITLYAKWNESVRTYTVTFNSQGGTEVSPQTIIGGNKATAPSVVPTKESTVSSNYTFAGWYQAGIYGATDLYKDAFDFDTAITNDITLYAKWSESNITYTVSFDSKGGTEVSPQSVIGGKRVIKPSAVPTKEPTAYTYFTFDGWYTSTDGGETLSETEFDYNTSITDDITLYAKWNISPITYKVTFYSYNKSDIKTVNAGEKVSDTGIEIGQKKSTYSTNYTFGGWYTSIDGGKTLSETPFDFDTPIFANTDLYVKWNESIITITVSFDSKGGTEVSPQTVIKGGKVTKPSPDPTKASTIFKTYTFAGWYTGSGSNSRSFDFNNKIGADSDFTIYAKWNETPVQYKVYFVIDDVTEIQLVNGGSHAHSYTPTKDGYTFSGWYIGDTPFDFNTEITSSDIYLTAKWTTANGINISIAPNPDINIDQTQDSDTITLTASSGFTEYSWRINGTLVTSTTGITVSADGSTLTITKPSILDGVVYQIALNAFKNHICYGTQISISR